ncbi:MAG TPA: two-component regulator propeller domain-containing protein, partial [Vicinamibacterales bacterium]|nr:two-component regulator propeller domain-containing protein [Vicinamibacterales bacterium]
MRIPAIALAIATVAAPVRAAARPAYALTAWTVEKGLPAGDVFAMAEDRAGYLWVGTGTGLARFDGVQFEPWSARGERLPGISVPALVATRDGSVWAGFNDASGVVRIRDGRLVHYYGEEDGLGACVVTAMLEDRRGALWVGCQRGLAMFDGKAWHVVGGTHGLPVDAGISALYEDRRGRLWVAAATGVYRRDENQALTLVDRAAVYAQSLTEDDAGTIWVSDSHRLAHRLNSADQLTLGPDVRLPSAGWRVLHDRHDALWIAALGGGLLRLDLADPKRAVERISYESIVNGSPRALFEDHEHNIWVGMRGGGLLRVSEISVTTGIALDGVTNDGVRAMAGAPDGSVWVATGHSLNRFDGSSRQVFALPQTLAVHVDAHGTLWAVTAEALGKFVAGRFQPMAVPDSVRLERAAAVTTDSLGDVWLCTLEQGVFVSRDGVLRPVDDEDVAGRGCSDATTDSRGRVWIGFQRGGVAYYDGSFHVFGPKDGLAAGAVLALREDATGDVWIGTNSGITRWSNGRLATVSMAEAFDGTLGPALIDDAEGQMWLSANAGAAILRFNRRDLDAFSTDRRRELQYSLYDASDGLEGATHWVSRPAVVRDGTGRLWFATGNGVVVVDPRHPPALHRPSAPHVEQITSDGRALDASAPTAPMTLSNSSSLTIAYSAISLSSGSKIRFRYMLEGLSSMWTDAGPTRTVTFDHLAPGRYRFRVAATTDGAWTEADGPWEFAVQPPFYLTIRFYVLLAAAALLTAWSYWQLRLRTMRKEFALVLAERARVGREIHDTLLQSLGAVGVELEVVASQLRSTEKPVADALTRLRREVIRCIREARESIWELRSSRLETRDLATALEELADDVGTARAVQVDVEA